MSEISIVVPLSQLPPGIELTALNLIELLTDSERWRLDAERYRGQCQALITEMRSAGASLDLILNEVDGEYERVQALRNFARELRDMGQSYLVPPGLGE